MLDIQNLIWKPKIHYTEIDESTTKFEVDYLPKWFWHSFGNAIRRAVLWYNYWWAVTWLKIKWIPHEYEVIDWVKESVVDIMLNSKKLRFTTDENLEKKQ